MSSAPRTSLRASLPALSPSSSAPQNAPRTRRNRVRAAVGVVAVGIVFGMGCGPDFAPAYRILNERVVAIVADPPEAVPGQQVRFTPLVVSPEGTLVEGDGYTGTWWRCPDEDGDALQDATRCEIPSNREDLATGAPYIDTIPPDIFPIPQPGEELSDDTKQRLLGVALGYWRVVGLEAAAPASRRVQAIKRVVVYAPVPLATLNPELAPLDTRVDDEGNLVQNENPSVTGVEVREGSETGLTTQTLDAGGTYFFTPRYDERTLQSYISLRADLAGLDDTSALADLTALQLESRFERVLRCEIPLFSWYVTAGTLRRETTVDERVVTDYYIGNGIACPAIEGTPRTAGVRYIAPEGDDIPDDGVVHAWVVMRDGRGGTSFRAFDFSVVP